MERRRGDLRPMTRVKSSCDRRASEMSTGASSSSAPPPAAASSSSGPNWAEIPRMGQPVAGFLPLKTPRTTPPDDESMFDVSMFVERQQSLGRSVGLCINLCGGKAKAAETYDTAEWDQWDVAYKAIACADEAVPAEEAVDAFVAAVGSLWSDPLKRKLYVAVHCATGFNVTGYMICRYLMRVGAVERAVAAFAAARAPGIYDGELLAALAAKSSATPTPTLDAPAPPAGPRRRREGDGRRRRGAPPPPPKPAVVVGRAHRPTAEASGGARRGEGGAQAGAGGGRARRGGVRARAPPHAREDDGGAGVVKEAARLCGRARAGGGVHQAGEPAAKVETYIREMLERNLAARAVCLGCLGRCFSVAAALNDKAGLSWIELD